MKKTLATKKPRFVTPTGASRLVTIVELRGLEPPTFRMRTERSPIELQPLRRLHLSIGLVEFVLGLPWISRGILFLGFHALELAPRKAGEPRVLPPPISVQGRR
jgi:hypothetical protein